MLKSTALHALQFAKNSIIADISRLYTQRIEEVAQIAEETRSEEARFSFAVELTMASPSVSLVAMKFIKQHRYSKRTVIKNPNQLDALAVVE